MLERIDPCKHDENMIESIDPYQHDEYICQRVLIPINIMNIYDREY